MFTANPMEWMTFEEASFYVIENVQSESDKLLRSVGVSESYLEEGVKDVFNKLDAFLKKVKENIEYLFKKAMETIMNILSNFKSSVNTKLMDAAGKYIPKLKDDKVFGKVYDFPHYDDFINFTHPICTTLEECADDLNSKLIQFKDVSKVKDILYTNDEKDKITRYVDEVTIRFNQSILKYKNIFSNEKSSKFDIDSVTAEDIKFVVCGSEVDVTKHYLSNNWDTIKKEVIDFSRAKNSVKTLYGKYAKMFKKYAVHDIGESNKKSYDLTFFAAKYISKNATNLLNAILLAMVNRYRQFTRIARALVLSFGKTTGIANKKLPDIKKSKKEE